MLIVGLGKSLDLLLGLWSPNFAETMLDFVFVEIGFEYVVKTLSLFLACIDLLRGVVSNTSKIGTGEFQL